MYLVIDIGGTYTKYGYYDQDGRYTHKDKLKTVKTNIDEFYASIVSLINEDVEGIAISMPGLLDSRTGLIYAVSLLPFLVNHNIKEELEKLTCLPVCVDNDAKCAAMGELWKGNLKNICNGLFIVLGSGIGGTLIINGEIVYSPRFKAGEIGSILMPLDNRYQEMTNFGRNNNANTLIHEMSLLGCEDDGKAVFEFIKTNEKAYDIFEKYCRQIAFMIYNLDYTLDLDAVVIGGGISEQDILISTIQSEYKKLREKYEEDTHAPIITDCKLHNDANLLGALYHYLKEKELNEFL